MAEGLSLAERVILDEALAHLPGGAAETGIARLGGGIRNRAWRVETRAGPFVVRLHPDGGESLGIVRAREVALHRAAATTGLAPSLVYADPAGRFLVTEYVAGRVWEPADFDDPDRLRELGSALAALHAVPPPEVPTFDLSSLLERHCDRLSAADPAARGELEAVRRAARQAIAASGSEGRQPAIVHNDLHHSNIISAGRLRLIDWEYAGVADPLLDLACLVAYYPAAGRHARLLLEAAGLASAATADMLAEAAKVFRLVSTLWERVTALPA